MQTSSICQFVVISCCTMPPFLFFLRISYLHDNLRREASTGLFRIPLLVPQSAIDRLEIRKKPTRAVSPPQETEDWKSKPQEIERWNSNTQKVVRVVGKGFISNNKILHRAFRVKELTHKYITGPLRHCFSF
jgi:hypothetical protein